MKARKRKKKMLWLLWVPAVLAVLFWWYQTKGNKKNMTEATFWEGPSSCGVGDLNYFLPEGCTQEQHPDSIRFSVEGVEVGGIDSYSVPENPDWNYGHWVEQLGLWEFEDETLGYSGSSSLYAIWEMEFFTDLPGGQPPAVQRYHYFFVSKDMTMAEHPIKGATVGSIAAITNGSPVLSPPVARPKSPITTPTVIPESTSSKS